MLFPPDVEWARSHSKASSSPWPLARGPFTGVDYAGDVDLGWWKNHPQPGLDLRLDHSDLDFFGGYDHGQRAGVVHVADHDTVPGKKFLTWGNGPDGRMWDQILTDEDGPYIELMTGGLLGQPARLQLDRSPASRRRSCSVWYPMRELGGLKAAQHRGRAQPRAARRARPAGGEHDLAPRRTRACGSAPRERVLFEEKLTLAPDAPFAREAAVPAGVKEEDLRLVVTAADGA